MKKWENPEVTNLGVENTRESVTCECCGTMFDQDLGIMMAPANEYDTWKHDKPHHDHCPNNPNKPVTPGFGPVGPVTPGLDATPIS